MGIVIREFACRDCGAKFESTEKPEEVACPVCSAEDAERVFLTAPSIRSAHTTTKDDVLKTLAADYGLTNMSNKDGRAVRGAPQGAQAPQFADAISPQGMQVLSRLGPHADGFSSVGSIIRGRGPNAGLPSAFPHQNRAKLKPT
jgi:putative FmdB family regulatory protein